jgi:hypothetical protein
MLILPLKRSAQKLGSKSLGIAAAAAEAAAAAAPKSAAAQKFAALF